MRAGAAKTAPPLPPTSPLNHSAGCGERDSTRPGRSVLRSGGDGDSSLGSGSSLSRFLVLAPPLWAAQLPALGLNHNPNPLCPPRPRFARVQRGKKKGRQSAFPLCIKEPRSIHYYLKGRLVSKRYLPLIPVRAGLSMVVSGSDFPEIPHHCHPPSSVLLRLLSHRTPAYPGSPGLLCYLVKPCAAQFC